MKYLCLFATALLLLAGASHGQTPSGVSAPCGVIKVGLVAHERSLIATPFLAPEDTLDAALASPLPDEDVVFSWDAEAQEYVVAVSAATGSNGTWRVSREDGLRSCVAGRKDPLRHQNDSAILWVCEVLGDGQEVFLELLLVGAYDSVITEGASQVGEHLLER